MVNTMCWIPGDEFYGTTKRFDQSAARIRVELMIMVNTICWIPGDVLYGYKPLPF